MNMEIATALTGLGLVGSIAVGASDIAGMGQTSPMPRYWNEPWLYFAGMSRRRIRWCMAGTLALPIASLGYFGVYTALSPAGTAVALFVTLSLAFFMLAGTAVHAVITILGDLADFASTQQGNDSAQNALTEFHRRTLSLFSLVARPTIAVYATGSFAFSVVIGLGATQYPRWVALLSPFFLTLALRRAFVHLPHRPFGLIRPAVVHLVHAPLLAVTLAVMQQP